MTVLDRGVASLHLRILIQEAGLRAEGEEVEFLDDGPGIGEAMVFEADTFRPAPSWRPIVPTLGIRTGRMSDSPARIPPGADFLDATIISDARAIDEIAEWLRTHIPALLQKDRIQLEILVQQVRSILDNHEFPSEDPDDVAQSLAAVETMEAQIKAPRPSRIVLKWAASQLPGFVVGLLSNIGNDALTHFIHL